MATEGRVLLLEYFGSVSNEQLTHIEPPFACSTVQRCDPSQKHNDEENNGNGKKKGGGIICRKSRAGYESRGTGPECQAT
jgi:hypothetical protein